MSRLRQNADRDTMRDFVSEINAQRGRFGLTSQRVFGKSIGNPQSTAGKYLKDPEAMPLGVLRLLVKTLKPNPIVLLKALGYTTKDIASLQIKPGGSL